MVFMSFSSELPRARTTEAQFPAAEKERRDENQEQEHSRTNRDPGNFPPLRPDFVCCTAEVLVLIGLEVVDVLKWLVIL
jgi:hypothetical protein